MNFKFLHELLDMVVLLLLYIYPLNVQPQELKKIHELESMIDASDANDGSLADLKKELALISGQYHYHNFCPTSSYLFLISHFFMCLIVPSKQALLMLEFKCSNIATLQCWVRV